MNEELKQKHTGLWFGEDVDILFNDWPAGHSKFLFSFAIFLVFTISMFAHIYAMTPLSTPKMDPKSLLRHAAIHAFRTFIIYLVPLCVITFNLDVLITLLLGQLTGFLALTFYAQYHHPR
ncbi:hypothetical protein PVL29_019591 [Vitis rotundifolia]|uniref:Copper transporter n=1 Tax=Vitis rotundifolia TaxID=103349 RepID=A0AA39DE08_VITRO|nr:hypothetical protein PVL29_019591 [Vitis rotundifolia]